MGSKNFQGKSQYLPGGIEFASTDVAYLNSGSIHPISLGAKSALDAYIANRTLDPAAADYQFNGVVTRVMENFAKLINADKDEVTFVQSTTAGEQLVLKALGLPEAGAHVVTDTLHFFGSFYLYEEMAKQGVNVTWLQPKNNRISLDDVEAAVKRGTKLIALSLVSTFNGFEHDLKRVCEIAHAKGALVYADIIHAAGCIPVDVKATGVDFAACASYKWLMGDFGLGFLYVRKELQSELIRSQFGYYQLENLENHDYPFEVPGSQAADYAPHLTATGLFAQGTYSHAGVALLDYSLDYLLKVGVEAIQAHARPLLNQLTDELSRRGFTLATPPEARAPLVTCMARDAYQLAERLNAAKVIIAVSRNRFRVSPSIFNTTNDIERLLDALGTASS
jgi:selenocysteine lyase/cysteine desulfurase